MQFKLFTYMGLVIIKYKNSPGKYLSNCGHNVLCLLFMQYFVCLIATIDQLQCMQYLPMHMFMYIFKVKRDMHLANR